MNDLEIGQRRAMSKKDIMKLNAVYKCKVSTKNSVTKLQIHFIWIFIGVFLNMAMVIFGDHFQV